LNVYRRVAFMPDTFYEVNGVAHTSRQFEAFARRKRIPFLSVRPGRRLTVNSDGAITAMELTRSRVAFGLDAHLDCDPLMIRHAGSVITQAKRLGVELVHITGPGDVGMLGWYVAQRLGVPLIVGWHTNLHEYAAKRLARLVDWCGPAVQRGVSELAERFSLALLRQFYKHACGILAPNQELVSFTQKLSDRPSYLMRRGVDTQLFAPARRDRVGGRFRIGYVGRLTAEKNVRFLASLGEALRSLVKRDFEFYIVGRGSESDWLAANVPNVVLPGVLEGEELARAYANMDLFVFPSTTDTFGNVVLEALASGVPCVVTSSGGPKFLVQPAITGYVAADFPIFTKYVASLVNDLDTQQGMREAARHYACGLSWDAVFETVFRTYELCLPGLEVRKKVRQRNEIALSA
jgi:phosphatidylinositol alpha 1,6-mannosyltransferase